MMEPPIAALLGAAVGSLAGLAGPLVGGSLQAARDKAKWRLDNQRDAYAGTLQHLSTALNIHAPGADAAPFLAELTCAQASLAMALVFCSESQHAKLAASIESLTQLIDGQGGGDPSQSPSDLAARIAKIHATIVECARWEFHVR